MYSTKVELEVHHLESIEKKKKKMEEEAEELVRTASQLQVGLEHYLFYNPMIQEKEMQMMILRVSLT